MRSRSAFILVEIDITETWTHVQLGQRQCQNLSVPARSQTHHISASTAARANPDQEAVLTCALLQSPTATNRDAEDRL